MIDITWSATVEYYIKTVVLHRQKY